MKRNLVLFLVFIVLSCKNDNYQTVNGVKNTQNLLIANYKKLFEEVNQFTKLTEKNTNSEQLKLHFKRSRLAFKKCEEFLAFYYPATTIKINGAAIDENEIHETSRKVECATGFQKVEEVLFDQKIDKKSLIENAKALQGYIQILNNQISEIQLSDSNIFEIQKLQLIRIMSLGISSFDSPIALNGLPETQSALLGIQAYINCYDFNENLNKNISKAVKFIEQNNDFNRFDRAIFITKHILPIYKEVNCIQKKLKIKNNDFLGPINFSENNPLTNKAFNINHFAPAYNRNPSKQQIELGKELFFDKILSGDKKVSCATCHIPELGYADHNSKAILNIKNGRNTPTLLNAGLQNNAFLDGRVMFLEDQAKAVIDNKNEMHGSFKTAISNLNNNSYYSKKFKEVFEKSPKATEENLLKALASFIRSLAPLNSKFDNYLKGKTTLAANERKGFNLFMGKAKCATCHFFPLFNGSVPPYFNKTESEVLGVPTHLKSKKIDTDLGEFLITNAPLKKHAFKTPTIRNSAITFPYMHHGGFNTLEEVVAFYNKGGGKGIGLEIENQTLPETPLNLTNQEIKELISFIKTLNDNY